MYVCMTLPITVEAQTASDFETRMKAYTDSYIEKNIERYDKEKNTMSEDNETMSETDFKAYLIEEAKSKFIQDNMKEYMNVYFPPSAMITGDTFVCDNGGFEEGFKYYKGYVSQWHNGYGGSICDPYFKNYNGDIDPITYTPSLIPYVNRFEIVTTGYDSPFGIKKVKFGNKAARINNKLGTYLGNDTCYFFSQIDRLEKKFKVTDSTKKFTIWYAVVLQNPSGHIDRQPFFNISCDRDPLHELCFDANYLKCLDDFSDQNCDYPLMKVLDWSCHTFNIPNEFVDSIATLTITVADCAQDGDLGFAYIDGICEPCYGSALGILDLNTIDYASCYITGQIPMARVCGKITPPTFNKKCDANDPDNWEVINLNIPGYIVYNLEIYNNNSFCFDFPLSNFNEFEECIEIYAEASFTNGTDTLPVQVSNLIEICKSKYEVLDCNGGGTIDTCGVVLNIKVGACNDNSTTTNISDDYYYVYVSLYDPDTIGWRLDRDLVDPYPNEYSIHTLSADEGDTINLVLGPFLIQEGDWWLEAYMAGCNATVYIEAPDYCSGCEEFNDAEIGNVTCHPSNPFQWYFTLKVPNDNPPTPNLFDLFIGDTKVGEYPYNTIITLGPFNINPNFGCTVYTLKKKNVSTPCESDFTICPPKSCIDDCRLELYVEDVECLFDPRSQTYSGHLVHLDISGVDPNTQHACVSYKTPGNSNAICLGSYNNGINVLGPFNEDIYLEVKICYKNVNCCNCISSCYKSIYIPKPDCKRQKEIEGGIELREMEKKDVVEKPLSSGELLVIPNPFSADEVILRSTLEQTVYEIYDLSGRYVQKGEFKGVEQKIKLNVPKGTYFIRYTNKLGEPAVVKMIKL